MPDTAVYIHIPFCDHKCIYCDFYSIITSDNIKPFLQSLIKEIEYYASKYNRDRKIVSVFFGGGTPSLMEPAYLHTIINTISKNFYVAEDAEITMETNPGTVNPDKLKDFRNTGINRISIGIQSFDDEELRFLTRIHDSRTAVQTVRDAERAGFNNRSIDLIFNLPGQTKEKWSRNLETAASLGLTHISAYSLILERGTILNKMVLDGDVRIQDDDYDADLYEFTIDYLTGKGFNQYEVSNFALPGCECIHNNAYWRYKDFLGFGPSAHSFAEGKRWWNYSSLKAYISKIDKDMNAVRSFELPDENQRLDEYVMLALRSKGIDLRELKDKFGTSWKSKNEAYLAMLRSQGFLSYHDSWISLTPRGYAVCDEILKNLQ